MVRKAGGPHSRYTAHTTIWTPGEPRSAGLVPPRLCWVSAGRSKPVQVSGLLYNPGRQDMVSSALLWPQAKFRGCFGAFGVQSCLWACRAPGNIQPNARQRPLRGSPRRAAPIYSALLLVTWWHWVTRQAHRRSQPELNILHPIPCEAKMLYTPQNPGPAPREALHSARLLQPEAQLSRSRSFPAHSSPLRTSSPSVPRPQPLGVRARELKALSTH